MALTGLEERAVVLCGSIGSLRVAQGGVETHGEAYYRTNALRQRVGRAYRSSSSKVVEVVDEDGRSQNVGAFSFGKGAGKVLATHRPPTPTLGESTSEKRDTLPAIATSTDDSNIFIH